MNGDQLCLPGTGSGDNFGTFPAIWPVEVLLNTDSRWMKIIKCPEDYLRQLEGVHYEWHNDGIKWRPTAVLLNYEGGTFRRGRPHDELGDGGTTHLTLLATTVEPSPPRTWDGVPYVC